MRCDRCEVVNDVHEVGCPNRLGSELYRTETAEERATLTALLDGLLGEDWMVDEWGDPWEADDVVSDGSTWEAVRRAIREGQDLTGRIQLTASLECDGSGHPWLSWIDQQA